MSIIIPGIGSPRLVFVLISKTHDIFSEYTTKFNGLLSRGAIFNPRRIKSIVLSPWPRLKTLQSEAKGNKTIGFFKMAAV
jgi:hypothetical protein